MLSDFLVVAVGALTLPCYVTDNYCDSFYFDDNVATARGPGQLVGDACLPLHEVPYPGWWKNCYYMQSDKIKFDSKICGPLHAVVRFEIGSVEMGRKSHVTCCSVAVDASLQGNRPLSFYEQHRQAAACAPSKKQ